MEHPEERYYKLNRFLLSVTGLWPYQSEWSARFIRIVITVFMLLCIFAQISSFFTSDVNMDFLIESLPMFVPTVGNLCQLYTRVVHMDKFKELFEHMWNDWAMEKTDDEIKIMHQHAETTRLLTICFLVLMYMFIMGFIVWLFAPEIFGVTLHVNESRLRTLHVEVYIDKERYLYLILSAACIIVSLAPLMFLATTSLYLALTQHVCGICELLGYRAERLFYVIEDTAERDLIRGTKINCKNIAFLIRQHYNVIQFIDTIETCHTIPLLMDLVGIVISISLYLMQVLTIFENTERGYISITFIIAVLGYLIIPNYMGQKVTEMSSSICEKVYNSAWYDADVSEQKSILLIMGRQLHPLVLTACKFYPMSLPSFKMILQMAISYCMFMRKV
ncbi:unnamed protein product [Lasius platythorax]|uniref:Odorant receptor n=1 Tax=Lasius platythorax TaxID=488582 RepID=A0AAV2NQ56_9HYME